MSANYIDDMTKQATQESIATKREPMWISQATLDDMKAGHVSDYEMPHLGDYVPEGWRTTGEEWFVDTSGFGASDESALTLGQFLDEIEPDYGYAITEAGQFQCYITQYIDEEAA